MQTTLAHMLRMLERPFGRKVTTDRAYLVEMANRIRQIFYNLYEEFEMEVDVTECFELQSFSTCHSCPGGYRGVTLPAHMQTIEAAWWMGAPLDLYSHWRQTKVGLKPANDCMLAAYDVPGNFPTERDICNPDGSYITIGATDTNDNNKEVEISYINPSGETKRESLRLTAGQPLATTDLVVTIKSIVLPQLRGTVIIKERCSGRVLSEYMPFETVPSYRRVKITGTCPNNQVVISASRQYQPVFWDTDIVETDNVEAIVNAASHIFYAMSGPESIQKAEYHKGLMVAALKGEASRDMGINRENDSGRFGPPIRGSRLISKAGGHNIIFRR